MKVSTKAALQSLLNRFGYRITAVSRTGLPEVEKMDPEFVRIFEDCKPYTMTSPERMYAVYQATRYVIDAGIPGDIVECGVWRGGCAMIAADVLKQRNSDKKIFMYDTYEGMAKPTDKDVEISSNRPATDKWNDYASKSDTTWCYASIEEVSNNMKKTGYDSTKISLIKGKVEDTIPGTMPEKISILRLDTDWYDSSYHELVHLFPRLSKGGVLLLDDYGQWSGARDATDAYFKENGIVMLLDRVDFSGRVGIKI